MWQAIVTTYEKAGLTEDDAIIQARCARILRYEDIDNEGEIILWTPPVP
jgi:DNA polymerase-1